MGVLDCLSICVLLTINVHLSLKLPRQHFPLTYDVASLPFFFQSIAYPFIYIYNALRGIWEGCGINGMEVKGKGRGGEGRKGRGKGGLKGCEERVYLSWC